MTCLLGVYTHLMTKFYKLFNIEYVYEINICTICICVLLDLSRHWIMSLVLVCIAGKYCIKTIGIKVGYVQFI